MTTKISLYMHLENYSPNELGALYLLRTLFSSFQKTLIVYPPTLSIPDDSITINLDLPSDPQNYKFNVGTERASPMALVWQTYGSDLTAIFLKNHTKTIQNEKLLQDLIYKHIIEPYDTDFFKSSTYPRNILDAVKVVKYFNGSKKSFHSALSLLTQLLDLAIYKTISLYSKYYEFYSIEPLNSTNGLVVYNSTPLCYEEWPMYIMIFDPNQEIKGRIYVKDGKVYLETLEIYGDIEKGNKIDEKTWQFEDKESAIMFYDYLRTNNYDLVKQVAQLKMAIKMNDLVIRCVDSE